MEIILDRMSPREFFENGGRVRMADGEEITCLAGLEDCKEFSDAEEATIGRKHYIFDEDNRNFRYIDDLDRRDPYGIRNCNFTLIDEDDSRWDDFREQRLEEGFDDSETWSLYATIARFILPRLKRFANEGEMISYPPCFKDSTEWYDALRKMIGAFEHIVEDEPMEHSDEVDEGLDLFRRYFFDLWD